MSSHQVDLQPEAADYKWLVGPEGGLWLKTAELAAKDEGMSLPRLVGILRRDLPQSRAHLVLEQLELRRRGVEKFERAGSMFFTRVGLEQATDQWVAGYKAGRFAAGEPVADFCCGIGGDLFGLAQRGAVWAVDRNPVAVILARENVSANSQVGMQEVSFDVVDVADAADSLRDVAAWHIDPDRRPSGRRTTKVEFHEPAVETLERLLAINRSAAIKLAPAADLAEPWWAEAELEWISRGRQCRQLVAWFGGLAKSPGKRRATVLPPGLSGDNELAKAIENDSRSFVGEPNLEAAVAPRIGRYLFEPDAAVLAAKLEGALAAKHGLAAISTGVAYFTGDVPVETALLACFEVLDVLPYRTKLVRQWLVARGVGRLEVKKRGVPLDPEVVRRELIASCTGTAEATVILMRMGEKVMAVMGRRVSQAGVGN